MKEHVKMLWKLCFTDSDEFIEMYFSLRYREEFNLTIRQEGKVVSALQMIPYPMTFCGHMVDTSYISGACTHPEERSHGYMKRLLIQSFERMQQQGVAFSTLIPAEPWLFDYYARFGYASVFYNSECSVAVSGTPLPEEYTLYSTKDLNREVYDYFQIKMQQRSCCIQHTETDFEVILADMSLSEGRVYWLVKDKKITALAVTYKEEKQLQVKEFLGESQKEKELLLSTIGKEQGYNTVKLIEPATEGGATLKLGMARIINAQKVLSLWASFHPQVEICIHLQDSQLPGNTGYYNIRKGICIHRQTQSDMTYTEMDIRELTEYILSPLRPYMSLMLN